MKKRILIYFDDEDKALWDKILKKYGSYAECAKNLGITPMLLNDCKNGRRPMSEELFEEIMNEIGE